MTRHSAPTPPPVLRPPFDAYHLPLPKRRAGPGAVVSLLVHGLVVLAVFWHGADLLQGGGEGTGPRGGGGGGARPAASFFTLPPPSTPVAVDIPSPPILSLAEIPTPDAIPLDFARIEVPRAELGATGPAGSGPGAGGGTGTGVGRGIGADAGPGTGGEGGYIFPANPRWAIVPPMNRPAAVRGRQYRVQFWVTADGRVSRVEVEPDIRDATYRREFVARMMGYLFAPAMTRNGERIASVYSITLTL